MSTVYLEKEDLVQMLRDMSAKVIPTREVMTAKQLAEYWQVSKQSVLNWARRPDSPLPCHFVGADPRFHRDEVNEWSRQEANSKLKAIDIGIEQ